MSKKTGLIRRELLNGFNNYIYNNNLKLNSAEKGNFSLCLKAEVVLPLM